MIKESIEFIAKKVSDLNLFQKVYQLVELVTDSENKTIPAVYISKGKYKPVEYSAVNGTAYLRKTGKISVRNVTTETYIGCEESLQIDIPLKLVVYKKKSKLPDDCSFTEEILAETILFHLSNNFTGYKSTVNARRFSLEFESVNTNSVEVWNEETNNVEQVDVNFDIACIAIEFTASMIADKKCLKNICEEITPPPIQQNEELREDGSNELREDGFLELREN